MKISVITSSIFLAIFITALVWLNFQWEVMSKAWNKYWAIEQIIITNELERVDADSLSYITNKYIGQSFWQIDLNFLASQIESINWISSVDVSLTWHGTLSIKIKEAKPIARWNANGLVDENGKVFFLNNNSKVQINEFDHLVHFFSQYNSEKNVESLLKIYLKINDKLQKHGFVITNVKQITEQDIEITDSNGVLIVFDKNNYQKQLENLIKTKPQIANFNEYKYFDLRYKNGLAIAKEIIR